MAYSYILYEKKDDRIVLITLNRPEKSNPLTPELREELIEALRAAERDEQIDVIVLTGAGKAFCAGGDIEKFVKRIKEEDQPKKRELPLIALAPGELRSRKSINPSSLRSTEFLQERVFPMPFCAI